MRFRSIAVFVLLLGFAIAAPTFCLSQNPGGVPLPGEVPPRIDPDQQKRERDLAKKMNQERQDQLKRDADTLLRLATELKQYVDKSNANTLSIEVVQKAEQIERLARSVKDKMKGN